MSFQNRVTILPADLRFCAESGETTLASLLVVGDDKDRIGGVKSLLALDGHRVTTARDLAHWRDSERDAAPEVVVAAVSRPESVLSVPLGGARGFAAPILFVQQESDEARPPFVEERLIDWIANPFAAEDFLGRVDALVRVRRVILHQKQAATLDDQPEARGHGWGRLSSLLGARVPRLAKPIGSYVEVAARVAEWSDQRDGFEPGHAERVANFAAMIADELGLGNGETASLLRAAMLHDIGKVALPIEVLRQRAPLEDSQMRLLRTHADRGAAILRALDRDDSAAETILHHHEHVDGSGYHGRKGAAIPLPARILAVAEGFDAMTTSLVRNRLSPSAALGRMRELSGTQWDTTCVDALVGAMRPLRSTIALA